MKLTLKQLKCFILCILLLIFILIYFFKCDATEKNSDSHLCTHWFLLCAHRWSAGSQEIRSHSQSALWHHGGCGKHTHANTHTLSTSCRVTNTDRDECVLGNVSEAVSVQWWINVSVHCAALLAYFSETLIYKPNMQTFKQHTQDSQNWVQFPVNELAVV